MIIDFSISNFRSFKDEQTLSMNVEGARNRHPSNYTLIEEDRIAVLRSAAIFGANASGKSNILKALAALRWIIGSSAGRKDGAPVLPFEPFRLSSGSEEQPVRFEIEFVVPSGTRYRYEVSFTANRIMEERLFSFAKRSRALVFDRGPNDTWENVTFGGTYKGGRRKFSFFQNASYLSTAGNDASSSPFIREIWRYFENFVYVPAGGGFFSRTGLFSKTALKDAVTLRAVSELICLADTGVAEVTLEEDEATPEMQFPDGIPHDVKEAFIAHNRLSTKFLIKSQSGNLVSFESEDMSDGTIRLVELLPMILESFKTGSLVIIDELNAHLHTDLVKLILQLFHDDEVNARGAQLIFSTHDTNILDSAYMRRDQVWFVSKDAGASSIKSLDEYDKRFVRQDGPFESFYREGRLGALPRLSYGKVKKALLSALRGDESVILANA